MTVGTFKQPDYANMSDSTEYPLAIDASIAVLAEFAAGFAVHEHEPADLSVEVDGGKVADEATGIPIVVAAQSTAILVPPVANPRLDIVYIDEDNLVGVAEGAEAGAPEDPTLPPQVRALARINWTVAAPAITNDMIDDLRVAAGGAPALREYGISDLQTFANGTDVEVALSALLPPLSGLPTGAACIMECTADRYGFLVGERSIGGLQGRSAQSDPGVTVRFTPASVFAHVGLNGIRMIRPDNNETAGYDSSYFQMRLAAWIGGGL